jgi:predicted nucleic acid-binding protein
MGLILDSGVFIRAERQGQSLDFSPWHSYGDVAISAVTASELLIGVHRADNEARRNKRSAFVEAILTKIPVIDFLAAARRHAQLFAYLCRQG